MAAYKLPYPPVKPNKLVIVKADTGMTKTGALGTVQFETKCFYVERHAWVQDSEGKKVESKGQVIILSDVLPELAALTGHVSIDGLERAIIVGKRLRNPDGTVHHVELELM